MVKKIDFRIKIDYMEWWVFNFENSTFNDLREHSLNSIDKFKNHVKAGYHNINISDHDFIVLTWNHNFRSDKPINYMTAFNNNRFPSEIIRVMNRFYNVPEYTQWQTQKHLSIWGEFWFKDEIKELYDHFNRKTIVVTRHPKISNNKVNTLHIRGMNRFLNMKTELSPYLHQMCPSDCYECWQHVIYKDLKPDEYKFNSWSEKRITHDEYLNRYINIWKMHEEQNLRDNLI